jgi:D-glycero-alpha-D-manno-heptose-7-phosphate kinase
MIVTKTPLRISFFGGGTDLPSFYKNHGGGLVLSTAIDDYINIAVNQCQTAHCRVIYSELEKTRWASDIEHDRVRHLLERFNILSNIEICSFSNVSTKGTGLGSSSSFTVGLAKALYSLKNILHNKHDLAELACKVEINDCEETIGKQDQYAAAYGGFNIIHFHPNDEVEVTPIGLPKDILYKLNDNLICYSTGITRETKVILEKQNKNIITNVNTVNNMKKMIDLTNVAIEKLKSYRLNDFGSLLNEAWKLKKSLSDNITNNQIDEMYEYGISSGALGGKLLGAGGGGYILFYVPVSMQTYFKENMKAFKEMKFSFTDNGSEVYKI